MSVQRGNRGRAAGLQQEYRSLTHIIVETLRNQIFESGYKPGARLNIAELATQFNVSPVPVREALRNLEAEGLVQFWPNRGVIVRELSVEDVRELFLMRVPLESLAAAEAIRNVDSQSLARLRRLLKRMRVVKGKDEWHVLHGNFHKEFYGLSRLPRVIQLIDVLRGQMRPYIKVAVANPEHLRLADAEHGEMLRHLERGEADELRGLIHQHLARPARLALEALAAKHLKLDLSALTNIKELP